MESNYAIRDKPFGERTNPAAFRGVAVRICALVAIIIAVTSSTSSNAETQEERGACINDAFRFCLSAIPDRSQVYGCLVANRALLSTPCRALVTPSISAGEISVKKRP
jgi:hypothetical protein